LNIEKGERGTMPNLPVKTYRVGRYKLAVWTVTGDDEKERDSLALTKSFRREKDGPWEEQTIYVFPSDLGDLIALLQTYQGDRRIHVEIPADAADDGNRKPRRNRGTR